MRWKITLVWLYIITLPTHLLCVCGLGSAVRIVCLKHVFRVISVLGLLSFADGMYTHNKEEVHCVIIWMVVTNIQYCVWFIYNYILFVKWKVSRDLKLIVNTVTSSVLCIFIYTGRWWEIFDALKWLESFFSFFFFFNSWNLQ